MRHEQSDGKARELGEETIFDRLLAGNREIEQEELAAPPRKRTPKMGFQEIADESVAMVMAGTETTATMLAYATYFFLAFPETQPRILEELGTIQKNELGRLPIQQIETLPYFVSSCNLQLIVHPVPSFYALLMACPQTGFVKETLRFAYGVPGRLTRVVPKGGLYVPSVNDYIPEGYVVGMSHMLIHNDPTIFESPSEFRPERWMGEKGKKLDHWLLSFSKGSRDCLGMK